MNEWIPPTPEPEEEQHLNFPEVTPETFDTPTQRATINMLDVDTLDFMLDNIRERRLRVVRKLEDAAKVKADDVRLVAFLKFQSQYKRASNAVAKLDEAIAKAETQVHKARLLAMAAELEVQQENDDADATVC